MVLRLRYSRTVKEIRRGMTALPKKKQRAWILREISKAPIELKPVLEREFLMKHRPKEAKTAMLKAQTFFQRDWRRTLKDFDAIANSPTLKEISFPGAFGWLNTITGIWRAGRRISIERVLSMVRTYRDHPELSPRMIILAIRLLAHNNRLAEKSRYDWLEKDINKIYKRSTLEKRAGRLLQKQLPEGEKTIYGYNPTLVYEDIRDAFPYAKGIVEAAKRKLNQ